MGPPPSWGGIRVAPTPNEPPPESPEPGPGPAPTQPAPTTPGPAGPATPGPSAPAAGTAGPTTGARGIPLGPDLGRWEFWWEHNREPYLRARVPEAKAPPATGTDGFFMGGSAVPERAVRREHVGSLALPELVELLDSERSRATVIACLHAIARIGRDHRGRDVVAILRPHLGSSSQLVRENAALALGITQRESAADDLVSVLRDTTEGRRLVRQDRVHSRTRAFAAYALGLIARAHPRVDFKARVCEQLTAVLAEPKRDAGDLPVAAVFGLRLLAGDRPASGGERRVLWMAVRALTEYYERDEGKADQALQAHVPPAIAALLGRGDSVEHHRYQQAFLTELQRTDRVPAMAQSAAIALGAMASPAESEPEDLVYSRALLRYARDGRDQQARFFAWIALGQIGGATNRGELLRALSRANNVERPWVALALGVLAHAARGDDEAQAPADATIGRALLHELRDTKNDDVRAALAVALGLVGYEGALPELRRLLLRYGKREQLGSYLSLALGLLDDRAAAGAIRDVLDRQDHRPETIRRTGIALAMLGDAAGNERVADVFSRTENAAALRGASEALGYQRGVTCSPRLLTLLRARDLSALAQANVAAALGRSADKDWLPWYVALSVNTNYRAAVPTLTDHQLGVLDRR